MVLLELELVDCADWQYVLQREPAGTSPMIRSSTCNQTITLVEAERICLKWVVGTMVHVNTIYYAGKHRYRSVRKMDLVVTLTLS